MESKNLIHDAFHLAMERGGPVAILVERDSFISGDLSRLDDSVPPLSLLTREEAMQLVHGLVKVEDKVVFTFEIIDSKDEKRVADIYGDYIFVVDGNGHFNDEFINKNEFVMVTSGFEYNTKGNMVLALIHLKS